VDVQSELFANGGNPLHQCVPGVTDGAHGVCFYRGVSYHFAAAMASTEDSNLSRIWGILARFQKAFFNGNNPEDATAKVEAWP